MVRFPQHLKQYLGTLILIAFLGGCTSIRVRVKDHAPGDQHREVVRLSKKEPEEPAYQLARQGTRGDTSTTKSLSALLRAVRITDGALPGTPKNQLHQIALREIVAIMQVNDFSPLPLEDGRALTAASATQKTLDPRAADELIPADAVEIANFRVRSVQAGEGVPYVARFKPDSPALDDQPGIPPRAGMCEPVTAVIVFTKGSPQLVFYRTLMDDTAVLNRTRVKLAADFSAPLAYLAHLGHSLPLDLRAIRALFRSKRTMKHMGLYQLSPFDPQKIPIVFVHGLISQPDTWIPALNELMADKKIRERYQFWLFIYPTGLSIWSSAAELRAELDRYRQTFDPQQRNEKLDRMVLAGHSMGGLITSLQIRAGGEHLWKQFLYTSPRKLSLSPKLKKRIIEIVEFQPRPEVARVVYFSTPHRGSYLAVNPVSEFLARLIRLPIRPLDSDRNTLRAALRQNMREALVAPANSMVFLRANSPLLQAILALPMKSRIPYHSVIGDRGLGDTPDSSDGVVPYWSSHLEGAQSEKIVPSGHDAHADPQGIAEFVRILRNH